jgi:hypothetical protein
MTYEALHNTIRRRFATEVAEALSLVTIYDNDPASPPTDGSTWCRFYIVEGSSRRTVSGVAEYRLVGLAVAQLYGPVGRGDGALQQMVDTIIAAFRGVSAGGLRYGDAHEQTVGQTPAGDYYQINVVCPFTADTQD